MNLALPTPVRIITLAADALNMPESGLKVHRLKQSHSTSIWHLTDAIDRTFILKIGKSPNDPSNNPLDESRLQRGEATLRYLEANYPDILAPRAVTGLLTHPSLGDRPYFLQTVLPGEPLSAYSFIPPSHLNHALMGLGAALAAVHQIPGKQFGYFGTNPPFSLKTTWAEAFNNLWQSAIATATVANYPLPVPLHQLCELYEKSRTVLEGPFPCVLCHGDIGKGNIIMKETGQITGLIDWEEALWAEPGFDLGLMTHLNLGKPSFYMGYKAFDLKKDPTFPIRMRLYQILKLIRFYQILQTPVLNAQGHPTGEWKRSNINPLIDEEFYTAVNSF